MRDGRVAGHWLGGHETESRQRGRVRVMCSLDASPLRQDCLSCHYWKAQRGIVHLVLHEPCSLLPEMDFTFKYVRSRLKNHTQAKSQRRLLFFGGHNADSSSHCIVTDWLHIFCCVVSISLEVY